MTKRRISPLAIVLAVLTLAGCQPLTEVGRAPGFQPLDETPEHRAIYGMPLPETQGPRVAAQGASLWSSDRRSLLGDRRARRQGDILTVVIEIDDSAAITNSSGRNRAGEEAMGIPQLFGLTQRIDGSLPEGASLAQAVSASGSGSFQGSGSIRRAEQLALRVAATVAETLPNGVLRITGTQEVRVNYELRELTVTGFVRPEDISRRNEIPYDRIAGARISYGGRGQITTVQQPRYGQQIAEILLPF
jgi:flagellar L-ring protein precursor FlgH